MLAQIWSTGNLSQNLQKAVIAKNIRFSANFTSYN